MAGSGELLILTMGLWVGGLQYGGGFEMLTTLGELHETHAVKRGI
jgi:hypothetical protein